MHIERVECALNLRDWKKKITDKLNASYDTDNLKEESLLELAHRLLQDYHDAMHCGHLAPDNRLPTDRDIQEMADIVLAILVEYDVISPFGSIEKLRKVYFEDLKNRYENS